MKRLTRREVIRGATAAGVAALGASAATADPQDKSPNQDPGRGPSAPKKAGADNPALRQMFAVVDARGKLRRGMQVDRVFRLQAGLYEVIFAGDVQRGVYLATVSGPADAGLPPTGYVSVQGRVAAPRTVL